MKKSILLFSILAFFIFANESTAQQLTPPQQQTVNKLFKTNKSVYFTFRVRSMQEIPQFSKILSVDKVKGADIFCHANKAQFTQFIRMNIKYTVTSGGGTKKKTTKTGAAKKPPVKKK